MMLRGMGFDNKTTIYLASGKIYQSERNLAPLLKMFPNLHTKDSLAMPDELSPFKVDLYEFIWSYEGRDGRNHFPYFLL